MLARYYKKKSTEISPPSRMLIPEAEEPSPQRIFRDAPFVALKVDDLAELDMV